MKEPWAASDRTSLPAQQKEKTTVSLIPASQRITAIENPPHGGVYPAQLRCLNLDANTVLDVSVNSNPYGPPPGVREALQAVQLDRYPDPEATLLREALAAQLGVSPHALFIGNGSAELFWLLALAYLDPGDKVLVIGPAFGEYAVASQVAGAYVSEARPGGDTILGWDATALRAAIRSAGQPKMVWFANPANPTGQYVSQATVEAILTVFDGLLVLDEAYRNFVAEPWPSLPLHESGRVVLVRSMTKDYALAGLRLGYVVAHPTIIAHLRRVRVPWSVNALAQAAGLAALQSESFLIESRARLLADRVTLVQALEALGWACVPTDTHFFLTRVPAPWPDAATVREALLRAGLMVRDCTSFGLPRHIRLATRRPDENERIVQRFATITL